MLQAGAYAHHIVDPRKLERKWDNQEGGRVIGPVLQHVDLQRLCRPDPEAPVPTLATVERWARKIGLRVQYDGRGGLWTTVDALNAALGLQAPANDGNEKYKPDEVF